MRKGVFLLLLIFILGNGFASCTAKSENLDSAGGSVSEKSLPLGTRFYVDGIHYEVYGKNIAKVTHPETKEEKQYSGDVSVPATVEYNSVKYDVTNIGEYAFHECTDLKSVTVAEGVREIGEGAFYGCSSLSKIVLPSSIECMSGKVLEGTAWYKNQPEGMVYLGKILYAYKGVVPENTDIVIKEGTRVIAANAFLEQKGLVSVTISDGVLSIGGSAFGWCPNLKSVEMPNSVREIFGSAFSTCSSLERVTLPEDLTMLDAMAFSCCKNLKEVKFSGKLKEIGLSSFAECVSLDNVSIPSNVKIIRSDAFWGCRALTSLSFEEGVEVIEKGAFHKCSNLLEVKIPQSVTEMGDRVFENTAWIEAQADGIVRLGNILYCYKGVMPEAFEVKVDEGIKGIAGRAFYNCSSLKSVDLPATVETIGEEAFFNCGLSSVTVPPSLRKIGFMAFHDCKSLLSVKISDLKAWCNIEFVGKEANPLHQCGELYLNDEILTDLVIPEGVDKVRDYSFVYGLCLKSVTVPTSVRRIGGSAFEECRALGNLTISDGVEIIFDNAFKYCMNLSSVVIPSSVRSIGFGAFEECYKLSDVTINEGVTEISNMAFDGCSDLKNVIIPSSVNRLGHRAFSNCMGLREVTCLNPTPPEADDSFLFETQPDFIYGLVTLKVPVGAGEKYKNAKDWKRFDNIIETK